MNRFVFMTSAMVELGAGALFLIVPSFAAGLAGAALGSVEILLARVFGAAACTLGGLCWAATQKKGSPFARNLAIGMLGYNGVVALLLVDARISGVMPVLLTTVLSVMHGLLFLAFSALVIGRKPR